MRRARCWFCTHSRYLLWIPAGSWHGGPSRLTRGPRRPGGPGRPRRARSADRPLLDVPPAGHHRRRRLVRIDGDRRVSPRRGRSGLPAAVEPDRRAVRGRARPARAGAGRRRLRIRDGGDDRGHPGDDEHRAPPRGRGPAVVRRDGPPPGLRAARRRGDLLRGVPGRAVGAPRHRPRRPRDAGEPHARPRGHRPCRRPGRGRARARGQHLRDPRAAEPGRPRRRDVAAQRDQNTSAATATSSPVSSRARRTRPPRSAGSAR